MLAGGRGMGTVCGWLVGVLALATSADGAEAAAGPATPLPGLRVQDFLADRSVARAGGRPVELSAVVMNAGEAAVDADVVLELPAGVRLAGPVAPGPVTLAGGEECERRWPIQAEQAAYGVCRVAVRVGAAVVAEAALPVRFLEPLPAGTATAGLPAGTATAGLPAGTATAGLPEPQPAKLPLLIGAHHCPLWEADKPEMWGQIRKHLERVPALGFYAQESPEVSDWETTWAVEHGVSFFIYCWYRTRQGGPVETRFSSAIHDGLFKSRYADKLRFTIMWENQSRGSAGVADESDLMSNLLPYWITTYFRHPSYLKIDNRPLLFIYRPEFLVQDLGGVEKVTAAFDKMRAACRAAGFDGLVLLGEYRGLDPNHLKLMKSLGLDYTFAYCWHVGNNPTPAQAITAQMSYLRKTQELGILPQVPTVSQGWTGWQDEGSIWHLPPPEYAELLRQAGEFGKTLPAGELGSRMLLLDNWNEWGEGHYIAPYTEWGFGYLDAVRSVFAPGAGPHLDRIPEDVGQGPYDGAYRQWVAAARAARARVSKRVTKAGAPAAGLVGWWSFDEAADDPVALDWSGHGLGGEVQAAARVAGLDGNALACRGGCVVVPSRPQLSLTAALSIECWVRTELAGQDNKWLVNRVLSGGIDTGYRLGVLGGKPCFEVPQTDWSHHLSADVDLPTGRWVHLAGTFDGQDLRLYVDGVLHGSMARPGPAKPNDLPLHLGSYERGHQACFTGLLDEVRLWSRALSAEEVAAHARPPAR